MHIQFLIDSHYINDKKMFDKMYSEAKKQLSKWQPPEKLKLSKLYRYVRKDDHQIFDFANILVKPPDDLFFLGILYTLHD